jgi:predicted RNA-binding Zn-ribbon protein involved in translation (DUF1610 family)
MPVTVQKISCQTCGAVLPLGNDVSFLSCNSCGSRLEVIRNSKTAFTKIRDDLNPKARGLEKSELVELYAELEKLEANWKRYCDLFFFVDRRGRLVPPDSPWVFRRTVIPSSVFFVVAGCAFVLAGLVWLSLSLVVMGLLLGRGLYWYCSAKTRDYEAARKEYQIQHRELKERIKEGNHVYSR